MKVQILINNVALPLNELISVIVAGKEEEGNVGNPL